MGKKFDVRPRFVRSSSVVCLLLLVAVLAQFVPLGWAGSGVSQAHASPPESRVLPQLQREARERPSDTFRVIVMRLNRNSAADAAAAASGGRKLRDLAAADGFVLELPGRAVMALGRNPAIKY
ncbi:MAG TPA: hypothetical protein VER55_10155, partial [Ardenticatenaceae bacterium]|nr:hypothetical protein [Ardenticatenaceae bacterium]